MPAGPPLNQARRIAADSCPPAAGKANSPLLSLRRRPRLSPLFAGDHAGVRGSPTPPFAGDDAAVRGKANPLSMAPSSPPSAGKANPPSAAHPARRRLWLPQARRPPPLMVKPAGCRRLLSSQLVMVQPAGRRRLLTSH